MHFVIAPTLGQAIIHLNQREGVTRTNATWRDMEGNSIKPVSHLSQLEGEDVTRLTVVNPNGFIGRDYMELGKWAEARMPDLRVEMVGHDGSIHTLRS